MNKIKLFFFSFLAMFIMVSLQRLGVTSPVNPMSFISPLAKNVIHKQMQSQQEIKAKLQQKANLFHLSTNQASFIKDAQAASSFDDAASYAVIDMDNGNILLNKKSDHQLPIASLTKIMTAVVALDLAKPDEVFQITRADANVTPTKIGVIPGQTMTLEELLNGLLLVSGNDAAETIKNGINAKYKDEVFIKAMNDKAKFLGLQNTSFANPQGFDDKNNYSSAEDLAILAHYAMTQYPLIAQIAQKPYNFLKADTNHKQFDMYNWNSLIGVYPGAAGLKIGNTDAAGSTMVVSATRGGKNLAVILLGAPDILHRDLWAAELLDVGFEKTIGLPPVNVSRTQLAAKYKTWKYWH
jgi:D-alanyl-D-alanine carboxypeptidase